MRAIIILLILCGHGSIQSVTQFKKISSGTQGTKLVEKAKKTDSSRPYSRSLYMPLKRWFQIQKIILAFGPYHFSHDSSGGMFSPASLGEETFESQSLRQSNQSKKNEKWTNEQ